MASTSKRKLEAKRSSRRWLDFFEVWNRKLHYYLGLYLLFFLWLFSLTGLMLNHTEWEFSQFWPQRQQSSFERTIQTPAAGGDLQQARDVTRQLGLHGEIEWTVTRNEPGRFDFRVIRPGHMYEVKTDLTAGRANVQQTSINVWGIMHVLHTFTGVRLTNPRMQRDWIPTMIWALSMDALAAGLIIMVFSSWYMWYGLNQKRRLGWLALGSGVICCGLFVVGLAFIY